MWEPFRPGAQAGRRDHWPDLRTNRPGPGRDRHRRMLVWLKKRGLVMMSGDRRSPGQTHLALRDKAAVGPAKRRAGN